MSNDAETNDSAITDLRYQLKKWEKVFADQNGGRKPGREDIRNDAIICKKSQSKEWMY